ncbi:MAG: hypothetical protein ACKVU0_10555 [Saprospiraceae bacterium]
MSKSLGLEIEIPVNHYILSPQGIRLTVYSRYLRGFTHVTRVTRRSQRRRRAFIKATSPAEAKSEGG